MERLPLQRLPLNGKHVWRHVQLAARLLMMVMIATPSAALPAPTAAAPAFAPQAAAAASTGTCERTITADVVALDQTIVYNRLGVVNPVGMIYALRRDVVHKTADPLDPNNGLTEAESGVAFAPGQVKLRDDRRPRPLTLRMNVGDCLAVTLQNLLAPTALGNQPATRSAGFHVNGLQLVNGIADDGSNVGQNASSLVAPGDSATYTLYAEREGTNLFINPADTTSGEGTNGTLAFGMFGGVNVEPRGAEWYRSQLTRDEMDLATIGTTPGGQPILDYDTVYPDGHRFAGLPILNILNGNEIVHSDLTAIVTGPNRGRFPAGTYPPNASYPDREQPFREFTVIFHDEIKTLQAFPIFDDPLFKFTLNGVKDGFAVNYGTGGIGAEIVANRLGVGPMWDCIECKYEEFFLTSWVVGDPAMVVDIPANLTDAEGNLIVGPKATKAFYADDPSNVYHSYLNDHVKIRNLHAGSEHHVFHLHAHQWLFTPDDDNSNYLDSQGIGPGSAYTYDIAYGGSGNRNKTAGDSIFHCHFYPHFAQGMWAMWRVHDTFELGTPLGADGRPAPGARALPDPEIMAGTPIPGLVPIPTRPMAPMPGASVEIVGGDIQLQPLAGETELGNPGYPFYIAGKIGHRPPTPPLDLVDDGGLPRHIITGGTAHTTISPLDMSRELLTASAQFFPEEGTAAEKAAMAFHEQQWHDTYLPDGNPAQFETNGLPRKPGAPYAEPCRNDDGSLLTEGQYTANTPRIYKGTNVELDMKINKVGWHVPQARIVALWDDVAATLDGSRPPEPFVMRANSGDCVDYDHSNLVPSVYEQDAFQVRTPTDIIGQHIHLVKFDVIAADGSANGWNYEDGTFSPDEVRERLHAIHDGGNQCTDFESGLPVDCASMQPEPHPFFGAGPDGKWLGARTTRQRWYVDPVVNNAGVDRTLGNVFTHDHYGPSTHQQVGLYGTLLAEPKNSVWRNPETGALYGTKQSSDGGPTSWRADIITGPNGADSYREFYFEFQDFQLAYEAGRGVDANGKPIPDPMGAINPPGRVEVGLPDIFAKPQFCPNGTPFIPNGCPTAISAEDDGTFSVNYRNEPLALRVRDPKTNSQAAGDLGDLSLAFSSLVKRSMKELLLQPTFYPPLTADVGPLDPFTPLLRVYANDKVRVRAQVGAHEEGHNFSIHGLKWLQEFASANSGWRNNQMMGISEQFIFEVPMHAAQMQDVTKVADHLYTVSASVDGFWNGNWGILRSYGQPQKDLLPLPYNQLTKEGPVISNLSSFNRMCPVSAPQRTFDVTAVLAKDALPGGTLTYNPRTTNGGPLHDPTAILYVRSADLGADGKLKPNVPIEPLILRASAGDCIVVNLHNRLPLTVPDLAGFNALPPIVDGFNANDVRPSSRVGLHPQLLAYDITQDDGAAVGKNSLDQTLPASKDFSKAIQYRWYAGDVKLVGTELVATPVEFGATNLISSDRIKHSNKGAVGALIVEPQGATWIEDAYSRASATVTKADGSTFRDFVLLFQDDVNMRLGTGNGTPVPFVHGNEDAEDSGNVGLNYRSEPLWYRLGIAADDLGNITRGLDFSNVLSNLQVGGDPVTPIFTAPAGSAVRFRVLDAGGHTRNHVFALNGHAWQRQPYVDSSTAIGDNPLSQVVGVQEGHGPANHWDIVPLNGAGGKFQVKGDYLYRDFSPFRFYDGSWGIFRVE